MIAPPIDVTLTFDRQASADDSPMRARSRAEGCARIKELGFTTSKHIRMYGERFEIVSDPFNEGECVAVHAISGNDPEIRTLRLPIAILVGVADRFVNKAKLPARQAL